MPAWRAAAAGLVLLMASACGLTAKVPMGPGSPTVGIEIFANDTREPDVERFLHLEMSRAIQQYVHGDLVGPGRSDVVLRGRVIDFQTRGGFRNRENQLREQGVLIRVQASLFDRASGDVLAGPVVEGIDVGFLLDDLDARRRAVERALGNLADALVLDLAALANQPSLEERLLEAEHEHNHDEGRGHGDEHDPGLEHPDGHDEAHGDAHHEAHDEDHGADGESGESTP